MSTDLDRAVRDALGDILDLAPVAPEQPTQTLSGGVHRSRRWAVAAAALVAVAGIAGLLVVQRPGSDAPADQPPVSEPAPQLAPEVFPTFPAGDARNDGAEGAYSQLDPAAPPQVTVGIARRDGDRIVEGIVITAYAQLPTDVVTGVASTPVTVAGETLDAYTDDGTPAVTTIVLPNAGIPVTVSGVDPVKFLTAAGLDFIQAKYGTGPDGRVVLHVLSLPAGYEQLDPETSFPAGARQASLHVSAAGNADGASIFVDVLPPAAQYAVVAPLVPVDINGTPGWASDGPGHAVMWQVGTHTWATVVGVDTTNEALALARDLRFVDEATWRTTYGVDAPEFPEMTPSCSATVGADAEAVRLAPTAIPDGMHLANCEFGARDAGDDVVERIYATPASNPELGPALNLTTLDARYASPDIPDDADRVTVGDVDASVYPGPIPSSRTVSIGPIDGTWYSITGYNVTRAELLTAAATVGPAPDGYGGTLDPAALPASVTELAAGTRRETWFIEHSAQQHPIGRASWTDDDERAFWYTASHQATTFLASGRIGLESVTDLTIQGHDGFHATTSDGFQTIGWSDGTITVMLGATGLTADELRSIAETIHQADQTEWNAILDTMPSTPMNASTAPATTSAE